MATIFRYLRLLTLVAKLVSLGGGVNRAYYMARQLRSTSKVGTGQLPFLETFLEESDTPDDTKFRIGEVKETKSRAGCIIKTDVFMAMIWKSDEMYIDFMALVRECVESNPAPVLYVVIDREETSGFFIEIDDEATSMWVSKERLGKLYSFTQKEPARTGKSRIRSGKNAVTSTATANETE